GSAVPMEATGRSRLRDLADGRRAAGAGRLRCDARAAAVGLRHHGSRGRGPCVPTALPRRRADGPGRRGPADPACADAAGWGGPAGAEARGPLIEPAGRTPVAKIPKAAPLDTIVGASVGQLTCPH